MQLGLKLSRIKWAAVAVMVLLLTIMILVWGVLHYHGEAVAAQDSVKQLQQEKKATDLLAANVIKATSLFNNIAQAAHDDNQASNAESDQRLVVIREAVKTDKCSVAPVPATAVDQLRANRNKVRSDSSSTDSGKPAG